MVKKESLETPRKEKMSTPNKPIFEIGEIVVMTDKKQTPFRIIGRIYEKGWFYKWNRNNYAAENMLRKLTSREKGELVT